MEKSGLILSIVAAVLSALAAMLLLYTSVLIFTDSLLPAIRAGEWSLARAVVFGVEFSGVGVAVPMLAYMLLGFIALAMTRRQAIRARQIYLGQ